MLVQVSDMVAMLSNLILPLAMLWMLQVGVKMSSCTPQTWAISTFRPGLRATLSTVTATNTPAIFVAIFKIAISVHNVNVNTEVKVFVRFTSM
jgi:hypothetical protein